MRHIDEIQIAGTAILLCGAMFAVSAVAPTGNTVSKAVTNFTEAPETAAEAQAQAEAQAEEDGFTIYTQESNYDSDYDNSYNDTSYNDSSYNTDTTQDGSLDDTGQENDNTDTEDGSSDDGSSDQTSSDDTGDDSSDQIDYPSDDNSGDDYGTRKIDGTYYCFDEDGILQIGWKDVRDNGDGGIQDYMYFGSDGKARIGWYSIEPPENLDGYDGDVEWFYFSNNGKPKAADSDRLDTQDLTRINGKKIGRAHV